MKVNRRNLFVTLRMLRTAGIEADARLVRERIQVSLKHPTAGQPPIQAYFEGREIVAAADWLVASVIDYYPESELAKVWGAIFDAVASILR